MLKICELLSMPREKELEIKNVSQKNLPEIKADADKTTWVLNNFFTNATKYSLNNNVTEVKALQHDGNIIFSVKNNGLETDKE